MKITKQRLKQIIREELQTITEGLASRAAAAFDDLDQQTRPSDLGVDVHGDIRRLRRDSTFNRYYIKCNGDLECIRGEFERSRRESDERRAAEAPGKMSITDLIDLYRDKVPEGEAVWHAQQDPRCVGPGPEYEPCKDFPDWPRTLEQAKAAYRQHTSGPDPAWLKPRASDPVMVKHRKWPGPDLGSGDKKAFRKAFAAAKTDGHKFFWFDRGKGRKPYAVK